MADDKRSFPLISKWLDNVSKVSLNNKIFTFQNFSRTNLQRQKDTDFLLQTKLQDLFTDRSFHSLSIFNEFSFLATNVSRKIRYYLYDLMEEWHPEVGTALETHADDTCIKGLNNEIFEIIIKKKNISFDKDEFLTPEEEAEVAFVTNVLKNLFFERLNISNRMWGWAKDLIKYGDVFLEPVFGDKGIIDVKQIQDLSNVIKLQLPNGVNVYLYNMEKPDEYFGTMSMARDYTSAFIWQPSVVQPYSTALKNGKALVLYDGEIVHLKLPGKMIYEPYGTSILDNNRNTWEMLKRMEDSLMIYRLTRAPERKVYYIGTGKLMGNEALKYAYDVMAQIKRKPTSGLMGGENYKSIEDVDKRFRFIPVDEDIWIPRPDGTETKIETLPGACLSLNTMIPLLDGRTLSLSDAINEFNEGKELWVYSCDPKTGKVVPGLVSWAGVTRKNTEVIKLTFENGETVTCTPDHKFPIRGKGKVEAQNLEVGDSMIPLYRKTSSKKDKDRLDGYDMIYDNEDQTWKYTHAVVKEYLDNRWSLPVEVFNENYVSGKYQIIHHKDMNKNNNKPSNLCLMDVEDHFKLHADTWYSRTEGEKEILKEHMRIGATKYWSKISKEDLEKKKITANINFLKGSQRLQELQKDPEYKKQFEEKRLASMRKNNAWKQPQRVAGIIKANIERMKNQVYKEKVYKKQRLVYDDKMMKHLVDLFITIKNQKSILTNLNSNVDFMNHWIELNQNISSPNYDKKFKYQNLRKLLNQFGYTSFADFKQKAEFYNHKLIKVDRVNELMDTGTLTIDADHKYHNYHTFAIKLRCTDDKNSYIFTNNSNLGDIEDINLFREKFWAGLKIPKAYLAQENEVNRATLVQLDVRFARRISRYQEAISDGLLKLAILHLYAFYTNYSDDIMDIEKVRRFLNKYKIKLKWTTSSFIEENARFEGLQIKSQIAETLIKVFGEESKEFVVDTVFQLSAEEKEKLFKNKKKREEPLETPDLPEAGLNQGDLSFNKSVPSGGSESSMSTPSTGSTPKASSPSPATPPPTAETPKLESSFKTILGPDFQLTDIELDRLQLLFEMKFKLGPVIDAASKENKQGVLTESFVNSLKGNNKDYFKALKYLHESTVNKLKESHLLIDGFDDSLPIPEPEELEVPEVV